MFSRNQKRNSRGISKAAMDVILQARYEKENQSQRKNKTKQRSGSNNIFNTRGNVVFPFKAQNDADEESKLQLSSTASDMTDDAEVTETKETRTWKSATDKKSGKIYYYNTITMESTWEKPEELSTPSERFEKEMHKRKQKDFFAQMESNIKNNLSAGIIPGHAPSFDQRTRSQTKVLKQDHLMSPHDIYYSMAVQHSNGMKQSVDLSRYSNQTLPSDRQPAVVSPDKPNPNTRGREYSTDEGIETIPQSSGAVITSQVREDKDKSMYSAAGELGTQATIQSVCTAFRAHIIESSIQNYRGSFECSESFNDCIDNSSSTLSPLANYSRSRSDIDSLDLAMHYKGGDIPSLEEIIQFFTDIFTKSQMETDCIVMSLIYAERLIKKTHAWIRPTTRNWRSLLLMCTMMASKVWDDISMINADFANICNAIRYPISLQRINELELIMLQRLKFRVIVSSSEYTKYNLFIRSLVLRPNHQNSY